MIGSINSAQSAIQAGQTALAVQANNLANVNTRGYRTQQATMQEAPSGNGVVAQVSSTTTPPATAAAPPVEETAEGQSLTTPSNVGMSEEVVETLKAQRFIQFQAGVIRTSDQNLATALNLINPQS
jgi:flagellar basal-body rod protein FlgC